MGNPPAEAEAVSRAEMQAIDRAATERFGVPSLLLMENAGSAIARWTAVLETEAEPLGHPVLKVLVVCGRGNNGGDGFVVARHLAAFGLPVDLLVLAPRVEVDLPGDAGTNFRIVERLGIPMRHADPAAPAAAEALIDGAGLIVDAIFGTGLTRPVTGIAAAMIDRINRRAAAGVQVIAVDIPSGLDCDTGEVLGVAVRATATMTVAAPKLGLFRGAGPRHVGTLHVVDFGCPIVPLLFLVRSRTPPAGSASGPEGGAAGRAERPPRT
ncbi:MAG: NAD(P)H-hydrate epimerase [Planctomycetes bacterium]|nr:NAD(P)H-hydrate epimerase [Planctomycetota bacterium]